MSPNEKTQRRRLDVARAMTALSHPRRVAIFEALLETGGAGLNFEGLLKATSLRRSSLAHHIGPMESAGLIRRRRKGVEVAFALHGSHVKAVADGVAKRLT